MFERTDHVLADVAGKPLIYRTNLGSKTLKLVNRHGANLKKGSGEEVLHTFLRSNQLLAVSPRTSCILNGSLSQELVQRTSGTGDGGPEWTHHFFRLLHGRSRSDLMRRCSVDHHEVILDE